MAKGIALAIDLGGTKVEAALVDQDGRVIDGSRFRRPTGREATSAHLAEQVDAVIAASSAKLPIQAELIGIGIGSAGPIVESTGRVSPLNLPAWRNYPLLDQVRAATGDLPVALHMDGLCITLAEHWVGAAQRCDNVLGMVVSTGIGGGLILGGVACAGPSGNAGHIGHVQVAGFTEVCACGAIGCVEAIASGPNTVAWARGQGWLGSSGEELSKSYRAGDEIAVAAVHRSGQAIGQAIASATALLDLELVAIGGGFSRVTPDLFDHIRTAITVRRKFDFVTKVRVVPSALSDDGPLIGAAALIHRAELIG